MSSSAEYNYCNKCGNETAHAIVGQCKSQSEDLLEDSSRILFSDTSSLLQCKVCNKTQLRVSHWNSENEHSGVEFYPAHAKHKPPQWLDELPTEYSDLAREIYTAVDMGSYTLALMGARCLLDIFISRHTPDLNSFKKKLEELVKLGALSAKQTEILMPTFDAGSAAAHRGFKPSASNVITALQVVENLIQQDMLGIMVEKLRIDTPPRAPQK
jgi:hypothetical protein